MRILFTGGGTGGHFYPIISIAEELNRLAKEKRLLELELYYMSPTPYNAGVLFENNIVYKKNSAGKLRRDVAVGGLILNFLDLFRTGWGVLTSLRQIYKLYPDVIFGKGGYASFPALCAAWILRIPIVIHESDTVPGRVNLWAGKKATKIALSYAEAAKYYPADKIAVTGQPVRRDITMPLTEGASEFLHLEEGIPVVFIIGGSQGAMKINDAVIGALKRLVDKCTIIHQVGKNNIVEIKATAEAVLYDSPHKDRYKPFDYLDSLALRMAAGSATLVISRAGSSIFEIASWGLPSIIIPINERVSRDQRSNAFAYAKSGACIVMEEHNLTPNLLASEVDRLLSNQEDRDRMKESAKAFFKPDAAKLVAEEILKIALSHEIEQ